MGRKNKNKNKMTGVPSVVSKNRRPNVYVFEFIVGPGFTMALRDSQNRPGEGSFSDHPPQKRLHILSHLGSGWWVGLLGSGQGCVIRYT